MEDNARFPGATGSDLANVPSSGLSTGKFKLSLGGANRKHTAVSQLHGSSKRPSKSLLGDTVDDDTVVAQHKGISTFGSTYSADEAEANHPEQNERIIKSIPNKDWRDEGRRKRQKQFGAKSDVHTGGSTQEGVAGSAKPNAEVSTLNGSVPKFGLNIVDRTESELNREKVHPEGPAGHSKMIHREPIRFENSNQPLGPRSADEEALSALLGHQHPTPNAIITPALPTEDDVFRDSYALAPRNCTLEEYEATPVEGYGAAILRGYLKEGQTLDDPNQSGAGENGKAGVATERRPGLLGLGAKGSGLGVELGAWGKGARRGTFQGTAPVEVTYNPLARRNKKTGELITEDDLNKRLESQKESGLSGGRYIGKADIVREQHRDGSKALRFERGSKGDTTVDGRSKSKREGNSERERESSEDRDRRRRREHHRDLERNATRPHGRREPDSNESDRLRRRDKARDRNDHDLDRRRRRKDESRSYVVEDRRRPREG